MKSQVCCLIGILCACCFTTQAQELNCKVTINAEQISGTNKTVFSTLETAITEFMNNRKWTDLEYQTNERIDCSLFMIVNLYANNSMSVELQVQVNRPVYNSAYKTPTFSFNDKNFVFSYVENDPLDFDITQFGNNLTEVLAFYAYIIIGVDCDSFSPLGGTPYFQKAEIIANQAQSSSEQGWKAFENHQNRYALISGFLDDMARPFREYFYAYHRQGLDEMAVSPDKGRTHILAGLHTIKELYKSRPSSIVVSIFCESKIDEIVQIASTATAEERKSTYEIVSYVAPTMGKRWEGLK